MPRSTCSACWLMTAATLNSTDAFSKCTLACGGRHRQKQAEQEVTVQHRHAACLPLQRLQKRMPAACSTSPRPSAPVTQQRLQRAHGVPRVTNLGGFFGGPEGVCPGEAEADIALFVADWEAGLDRGHALVIPASARTSSSVVSRVAAVRGKATLPGEGGSTSGA